MVWSASVTSQRQIMFRGHLRLRVALIASCACFSAASAVAQQAPDLFGEAGPEKAVGADPSAVPGEAPATERSGLAVKKSAVSLGNDKDFCRCVGESSSPAVARIENALD